MKLYYSKVLNFGDRLNEFLWPCIFGDIFDNDPTNLFVGIGTLLNDKIPIIGKKIVFGAGCGYGPPPILDDKYYIYCVRGPMTAHALNINRKLALTDSAILVARFIPQHNVDSPRNILLIPHHVSAEIADWYGIAKLLGWDYLDPKTPAPEALRRIAMARLVVTEAMHGAIIADAYRVPWVAYKAYEHINDFKWNDWTASLEMRFNPIIIPSLWNFYRNASTIICFKVALKRFFLKIGIWHKTWDKPHHIKSNAKTKDKILSQLASSPQFANLSPDDVHVDLLDNMSDKLKHVSAIIRPFCIND